ncbi:hypothetical protein FEM08_10700 [Flavobacterium gilvum]|nr:hypothetical protein FEM08_10700 [Flavobacterium gilvum]
MKTWIVKMNDKNPNKHKTCKAYPITVLLQQKNTLYNELRKRIK